MANATTGGHVSGLGATGRTDAWWVGPALTAAGLGLWLLYYTWAALQGSYYAAGPYLSPFYAPLLYADPTVPGAAAVEHAFLGAWPAWWPAWLPPSPALLIFVFPATFRATCYYYRKAYYRAFFGMPPGCAVGPVPHSHRGETFLLIFQNLHRYTLYFAILLLPFLYLEAFSSFFLDGQPGVGVGSVLILVNALLLTAYTFGCHAWRHLIGGRLDCFSCAGGELAHGAWTRSTWFNQRHMGFAWASLYWILLCDLYVRGVSMGMVPDLNTWHGLTWASGF